MSTLLDEESVPISKGKDWNAAYVKFEKQQLEKINEQRAAFNSLSLSDVTDDDVRNARHVYENHLVPTKTIASLLESGYFCILSQSSIWEKASQFVYQLRRMSYPDDPLATQRVASIRTLTNHNAINLASKSVKHRWSVAERCNPFLDYYYLNPDQIEIDFAYIGKSNPASRLHFCDNVKYFGLKTYSFFDLLHGGTGFITLDVHVLRGLNKLGVKMNEWYLVPKPRKPTDKTKSYGRFAAVTDRPTDKVYLNLEAMAMDIFSKDDRFLLPDGKVNGGLATTLLWWMGAGRRDETFDMFGYHSSQELPYGPKLRVD